MFASAAQRSLFLVSSCFWLSGLAALIYQTAWLRRFSIVFGTSEMAVVVVLSSYMAGLALGAVLAARLMPRISRPVLFYGVLEAVIALVALLFPVLLDAVQSLFTVFFGNRDYLSGETSLWQSVYFFVGAFVVILIPTTAMGATLPVLSKSVISEDGHIAGRIGLLYAINTAGAVAGTLLTAFVLLPALGLRGSIYCAIAINVAVFFVAVALERYQPAARQDSWPKLSARAPVFSWNWRGVFLVAIMASGVVSFTYEVLWTRLLGHILGGSVAAFATMLASFLGGIALGSLAGAGLARDHRRAVTGFWFCQIGIALSSAAVYYGFEYLAGYPDIVSGWKVSLAILTMLPSTLFIGATFPMVVRACAPSVASAPSSAGIVYGWNTVGAIAGAVLAGFFLVPLLKYEGAIRLAVLFSLAVALVLAFEPRMRRSVVYPLLSLGLLAGAAWLYHPTMPINILRNSPIGSAQPGDVLYYDVGRSATVLVQEYGGNYYLRTNGLPEANTRARARSVYRWHSPLMSLPALIRPAATEALVIGLGAGALLEHIPAGIERVDVIELEPRVVQANRFLAGRRQTDPLSDERVHIHISDARGALQLTRQRWDIVISQPSHPWTAGASHLYTEEFMRVIDDHLERDGVYLQWMNASYVSRDLLASLLRALNNVFAYVRVYQIHPQVLYFLSSQSPVEPEREYHRSGRTAPGDFVPWRNSGIRRYHELLSTLLMDEESTHRFSAQSPAITDEHNYMATDSLRAVHQGTSIAASGQFEDFNIEHARALNDRDWLKSYLSGIQDWVGVHDSLLYGREKFLDQLKAWQPQWAEYIESRRALFGSHESAALEPPTPFSLSARAHDWTRFATINRHLSGHPRTEVERLPGFAALPASAQASLRARVLLKAQEYHELRELDNILARAEPGQPWHSLSVMARAAWRVREIKAHSEQSSRFAQEVRTMLDDLVFHGSYDDRASDYLSALLAQGEHDVTLAGGHGLLSDVAARIRRGARVDPDPGDADVDAYVDSLNALEDKLAGLREVGDDLGRRAVPVHALTALVGNTERLGLDLQKLVLRKGYQKTLFASEAETDLSWGEVTGDLRPANPDSAP